MSQQRDRYYLDIEKIRAFLPHRAPFLLVDRILEIHPKGDLSRFDISNGSEKVGTKVVGIKNFTFNEPFIPGHFPNYSIVPGVIQIETMAQVASFALYPFFEGRTEMSKGFQCILVGVDSTRFRKPVIPGDVLRVEAELTKARGKIWGFHVEGFVDGQRAVEADILANLE
ncbi:beta-hydroxyacyl-ACP dehydratase, partial [bacterium]|nr:beta-hydroxyacyl-ACP dehydratase [bacterium]